MNKFPYYIEDWLEFLNSSKDIHGNDIFMWEDEKASKVNLANYDVSFISSTSSSFNKGQGLTRKQLNLATKIIVKYKRQLATKHNLSVDYIEAGETPLRYPIRSVITEKFIRHDPDTNKFVFGFPYHDILVNIVRNEQSTAKDFIIHFDTENKIYSLDYTEPALAWLYEFVTKRIYKESSEECLVAGWTIDQEIWDLFEQVEKAQRHPDMYLPAFDIVAGKLVTVNSNSFIDEALEKANFGKTSDDVATWVALKDQYGLSVTKRLEEYVQRTYSSFADLLLYTKDEDMKTLPINEKSVANFIQKVNIDRWVFINGYAGDSWFANAFNTWYDIPTKADKKFLSTSKVTEIKDFLVDLKDSNLERTIVIMDMNQIYLRNSISEEVLTDAAKCIQIMMLKKDYV